MNFGEKVRLLRTGAQMSQTDLAAELGVSTRTVQSYEKGQSYPKQRSIYAKLASLFNVEQNYLLTVLLPAGSMDHEAGETHRNS